ncbi:MAG: hypothetical protein A2161_20290 [Candidatus Schekmanbacteria bacterium RBG_13_48_7]|uniref:Acriflavine resistance protein B n=1 Tax=Candidatus Schekmanbacteria bacterium RBG_13_48_7 TaxID=1817878 RepID=A0A1F7RID3_9BACT|nr:MAG: hypothetical protein A2161_20290 [Candidatus Schekmanbacteria bacterium RBG_13_48_7]
MGILPIALGFGAGAEARRPIGLAVVGGLIFAQIITLYITPVFYMYMEAFKNKITRIFKKPTTNKKNQLQIKEDMVSVTKQ